MSVKNRLRNSAAELLFRSGLTAPGRRARARLSIATFHRVLPEAERRSYPFPGLVVTPEELDALLAYFTKYFDCGTLAGQHERYLGGQVPPRPLLALTFDDAQYDNHLYARPVLARHRLKGTFFAPVVAVERRELLWHDRLGFAILALQRQERGGRERVAQILAGAGLSGSGSRSLAEGAVQESKRLALDARLRLVETLEQAAGSLPPPDYARLMTFDELAELAADGHEIGSHSMTHCLMPECDDRALDYELSESRRILQSRIAQPIDAFCYPNGDCDARSADAAAKAGYRRAVTTAWGINSPDAHPFRLRRFDMSVERARNPEGEISHALVAFRMSGFYPGLG
jgi:peptidoglycan/xylan/chitin deacetylase (PgdA/CDA1 family)